MKYIKGLFLLSIIVTLLSACNGDFFETQLDLPTPKHTPTLAVSAFLSKRDTFTKVYVGNTVSIFSENNSTNPGNITDAKVRLYEEGNLLFNYQEEGDGFYFHSNNDVFLTSGKSYELQVEHSDYTTATATQVLPTTVPLSNLSVIDINRPNSSSNKEISFTINDPSDVENFYELTLLKYTYAQCLDEEGEEIYSFEVTDNVYIDNNEDISIQESEQGYKGGILYSDALFNGQNKEFKIPFHNYESYTNPDCAIFNQEEHYILIWKNVTKDYYLYSKSLYIKSTNGDNPFAEPVSVYSNFTNGIGAFCLYTKLEYEF